VRCVCVCVVCVSGNTAASAKCIWRVREINTHRVSEFRVDSDVCKHICVCTYI